MENFVLAARLEAVPASAKHSLSAWALEYSTPLARRTDRPAATAAREIGALPGRSTEPCGDRRAANP